MRLIKLLKKEWFHTYLQILQCHEVERLPVPHCELNPIEMSCESGERPC